MIKKKPAQISLLSKTTFCIFSCKFRHIIVQIDINANYFNEITATTPFKVSDMPLKTIQH